MAGGFVPGFAARHDAAAALLVSAFPAPSFAALDLRDRAAANMPKSFVPEGPRHFSPADPGGAKPTEGWNPLDPTTPQTQQLDAIAAAHAAGYAAGLAAAAEAAKADGRDDALISGVALELGASSRMDRELIAQQLRETVLALVTKLVGEVGIAPDILARRIDAAAGLLADAAESALLRVHPDDVALLDGRLPATIFAAGDPGLARGSFVLESASTLVEDGPTLWLEQLSLALERVSVPDMSPPC